MLSNFCYLSFLSFLFLFFSYPFSFGLLFFLSHPSFTLPLISTFDLISVRKTYIFPHVVKFPLSFVSILSFHIILYKKLRPFSINPHSSLIPPPVHSLSSLIALQYFHYSIAFFSYISCI